MTADGAAPGGVDVEDLTARARIRNAALVQLAERGSTATTIRSVAAAAGVSPSLVQHHFGSKDGLRDACDAYVVQQLRAQVAQGVTEQALGDPAFVAQVHQTAPRILRYLARALMDGWPAATTLFDEAMALTEAHLTRVAGTAGPEVRTQAAVLTAMKLGVVVLHEQLSRVLATDTLAPAGIARVTQAAWEILSPAVLGEDLANAARRGQASADPA